MSKGLDKPETIRLGEALSVSKRASWRCRREQSSSRRARSRLAGGEEERREVSQERGEEEGQGSACCLPSARSLRQAMAALPAPLSLH